MAKFNKNKMDYLSYFAAKFLLLKIRRTVLGWWRKPEDPNKTTEFQPEK